MRSKRLVLTILILCMLVVLAGCRVVAFEGLKEKGPGEQEGKEAVVVDLRPKLVLNGTQMVVRGKVSLPEGTVVTIQLKQFPENEDAWSISCGTAQPMDEVLEMKEVEVKKDSEFGPILFKRKPYLDNRYRIEAIIDPKGQNGEATALIGSYGEHVKDSNGVTTVTEDGQEMVMIMKYADVVTYDEGDYATIHPRSFVVGEEGEEINSLGEMKIKCVPDEGDQE
ncbi:hypothetical protein [Rossellomorea marisflavi]|uniref:hypothetical protein n=1 Tax=Rossellomorea marisflavi TaxID=189381 RepID=UPI000ACB16A5|nr:hypothetical protein [Rossellomorea marisflavi]